MSFSIIGSPFENMGERPFSPEDDDHPFIPLENVKKQVDNRLSMVLVSSSRVSLDVLRSFAAQKRGAPLKDNQVCINKGDLDASFFEREKSLRVANQNKTSQPIESEDLRSKHPIDEQENIDNHKENSPSDLELDSLIKKVESLEHMYIKWTENFNEHGFIQNQALKVLEYFSANKDNILDGCSAYNPNGYDETEKWLESLDNRYKWHCRLHYSLHR